MRKQLTPIASFLAGFVLVLLIANGCRPRQDSLAKDTPAANPYDIEMDRFDSEIRAFQSIDARSRIQSDVHLFVGSSSIRKWETMQADLAPHAVLNRGFGGSTLPEVNHYFEQLVAKYQPKTIFLYEGDNDIAIEAVQPDDVLVEMVKFDSLVEAHIPGTPIYCISVKPAISRKNILDKAHQTNQLLQAWTAEQPNWNFVDVASPMMDGDQIRSDIFVSDSLHMNARGYELWTAEILPILQQLDSE
ncbi:GDSL-type esterase/lipase family protein [Pontibacter sp. G13]|uniref:GDSL-type esterase/lipase family protein n=1 Tax=Pontibacter sp. G13 TaxID=3074898 RepID=UPI00288A91B6|nr:GDSL-type esterase/lipase family protein [Pontibacter sp. G13]WNJ17504.1 GDSL-type esterase/lipase family protein [Pontibacter sp. G13]